MLLIMVWMSDQPIYQQAVRSQGIEIERDVWLGAHVGIKDGVHIA